MPLSRISLKIWKPSSGGTGRRLNSARPRFSREKYAKKCLHYEEDSIIITFVVRKETHEGLSPNGKATDSDSVSSRFESL